LDAGDVRSLFEEAPEAIRRAAEEARAASEVREAERREALLQEVLRPVDPRTGLVTRSIYDAGR
jgi:hypothetical protein